MSIRTELNALRAELDALKASGTTAVHPDPPAAPNSGQTPDGQTPDDQLRHLMALAQDMVDEAEDTVAAHPKAALAGALALGLVIGRLTAR